MKKMVIMKKKKVAQNQRTQESNLNSRQLQM